MVPPLATLEEARQLLTQKLNEVYTYIAANLPTGSAGGQRLTDVGDPQSPQDAVTLGFLQNTLARVPTGGFGKPTGSLTLTNLRVRTIVVSSGITTPDLVVSGTTTSGSLLVTGTSTLGDLVVTGTSTLGDLIVTGTSTFGDVIAGDTAVAKFGANGASPQGAAASGGAVAATATNVVPWGYSSAAEANAIVGAINTIQSALIAAGLMS